MLFPIAKLFNGTWIKKEISPSQLDCSLSVQTEVDFFYLKNGYLTIELCIEIVQISCRWIWSEIQYSFEDAYLFCELMTKNFKIQR